MMNKMDEEYIKKQLKNMPKVNDDRTKEEWIERVQPYKYKRERTRKKSPKMIPILSTVLLIGMMVLIIPTIIQEPSSVQEQTSSTHYDDHQVDQKANVDQQLKSAARNEEVTEHKEGEYVMFDLHGDEQVVYGGIFDQQVQYIIPLAFVSSEDHSLSELYTELDSYIDEFDLASKIPYFKDTAFSINMDEKNVTMHVPDDYSIGEGSAVQGKFEEMLSRIFYPYEIDQVLLESSNGSPVTLGEKGELDSITVHEPVNENYKLYDDEAHDQRFMVPMNQEDKTFAEAIEDLKNDEQDYSIQNTIPQDVDVTVTCESEESCSIQFQDTVAELPEQDLIVAVESILMTAKSYGFDEVAFKGIPNDAIGSYNLSEPITVPLAVNPMYIHEE